MRQDTGVVDLQRVFAEESKRGIIDLAIAGVKMTTFGGYGADHCGGTKSRHRDCKLTSDSEKSCGGWKLPKVLSPAPSLPGSRLPNRSSLMWFVRNRREGVAVGGNAVQAPQGNRSAK